MPKPVNPICGRPGCRYTVPHEHVHFIKPGLSIGEISVQPPVREERFEASSDVFSYETIAAKLKSLQETDDPEADRFEGKSPVEIQVTLLGERMAKYADQTDKALATMSDVTRKTHTTIKACWEHWRADQQRPAWAQDFAIWLEELMPRKDEIHRIGGDTCTVKDNVGVAIAKLERLLWRRLPLSIWGVVLGTVIGVYASLAGVLLVIVVAAHTQQFWNWIMEGLGL